MRLYDEKRPQINAGDRILFSKIGGVNESFTAEALAIYVFPSLFYTIQLSGSECTVKELGVPACDYHMLSATLAADSENLVLNAVFDTTEAVADTWFFDTETEKWTASEKTLDTALSSLLFSRSSALVAGRHYVTGKSRNGNLWFMRTLDMSQNLPSYMSGIYRAAMPPCFQYNEQSLRLPALPIGEIYRFHVSLFLPSDVVYNSCGKNTAEHKKEMEKIYEIRNIKGKPQEKRKHECTYRCNDR